MRAYFGFVILVFTVHLFIQASRKSRGNVDAEFWKRLDKLIRVVLPSWRSREARYIYILSFLLVLRTLMSIWLADVNGKVVKAIVNKSFPEFLQRVSLPIQTSIIVLLGGLQIHFEEVHHFLITNRSYFCRFSTCFCSLYPHRPLTLESITSKRNLVFYSESV